MNYEEFQEAQSQPQSTGREVNELIAVLDRVNDSLIRFYQQQNKDLANKLVIRYDKN